MRCNGFRFGLRAQDQVFHAAEALRRRRTAYIQSKSAMHLPVLQSVQEALSAYDKAVDEMIQQLQLARTVRSDDRQLLMPLLGSVFERGGAVRTALADLADAAREPVPEWATHAELELAVVSLAEVVSERAANRWRDRLRGASSALSAGRVIGHKSRRVIASLDSLRSSAAAEAARVADGALPVVLPGPSENPWLDWVFDQPTDELETLLAPIRDPAPFLYQFLLDINPVDWQGNPSTCSVPLPVAGSDSSVLHPPFANSGDERSPPDTGSLSSEQLSEKPRPTQAETPPLVTLTEAVVETGQGQRPQVPAAPVTVSSSQPLTPVLGTSRPDANCRPSTVVSFSPPAKSPSGACQSVKDRATSPAMALRLATVEEIASSCVAGDYLRATLLAAGRALGGLPDVDPRFDALLVSHHVCSDSPTPPWPEWCNDAAAAAEICQAAPDSSRLTFLAVHLQLSRSEGADALVPEWILPSLLPSFNDLPEVRSWLGAFLDVTAVPGLWEQLCRIAPPEPLKEYRERRRAFAERYESGLLHRSDKVAYIHRQDNYLSRQPAFRLLHGHLKPAGPETVVLGVKKQIEDWLKKKPEWITDTWLDSTQRVSGKLKLHGNHRAELVRRAAEYLEFANRAWRAAHALLSAPPPIGDVEKRRNQLRDLLPSACVRAQGRPWGPLFQRLVERLPS